MQWQKEMEQEVLDTDDDVMLVTVEVRESPSLLGCKVIQ